MPRSASNDPSPAIRTPINAGGRTRIDEFLTVMERLAGLHDDLCGVMHDKLERMRRADHSGMQEAGDRERRLVLRINEQEGLRKQLMERVGRGFGMAPATARSMPARELAQRLGEPDRSRVTTSADRLLAAAKDVHRLNALIGRVSQQVLENIHEIYAAVTGTGEATGVYTSSGRRVERQARELFEMVG